MQKMRRERRQQTCICKCLGMPALPDGHLVQVGIRPEHARLTVKNKGTINANADMVEELGAGRLCNLMFEDIPLCVLTEDRPQLAMGDPVGVHLPPDRIHLFDSVTEKRIEMATSIVNGRIKQQDGSAAQREGQSSASRAENL